MNLDTYQKTAPFDFFRVAFTFRGDKFTFIPKIPNNIAFGEEQVTPRTCWAPTIENCLKALDFVGEPWFAYGVKKNSMTGFVKPHAKGLRGERFFVPDCAETGEVWTTEPTTGFYLGKIESVGFGKTWSNFDIQLKEKIVELKQKYIIPNGSLVTMNPTVYANTAVDTKRLGIVLSFSQNGGYKILWIDTGKVSSGWHNQLKVVSLNK